MTSAGVHDRVRRGEGHRRRRHRHATTRTPDQTVAGIYWAYDGAPSLCAPPRLYNQIAVLIGLQQNLTGDRARPACSRSRTSPWPTRASRAGSRSTSTSTGARSRGIRESDPGTGPSGLGDGNAATMGDVNWTPLGAPAATRLGPNFTPPFPAYPSGHADVRRRDLPGLAPFFGTDNIPFTFVSDEFNGVTLDNQGNPRPLLPRSFTNFTQAEEENGQSRIYLGIHWVVRQDRRHRGGQPGRRLDLRPRLPADSVTADRRLQPAPHRRPGMPAASRRSGARLLVRSRPWQESGSFIGILLGELIRNAIVSLVVVFAIIFLAGLSLQVGKAQYENLPMIVILKAVLLLAPLHGLPDDSARRRHDVHLHLWPRRPGRRDRRGPDERHPAQRPPASWRVRRGVRDAGPRGAAGPRDARGALPVPGRRRERLHERRAAPQAEEPPDPRQVVPVHLVLGG